MKQTWPRRETVQLDFLEANQILAALDQRGRTLYGHRENGVDDAALEAAIRQTARAASVIREAFRLRDEDYATADELALLDDIPLALLTYMGEGR